ncbi:LacI family transcriptional regulator [Actinorhabdospora filicis]|uniref:LacI family transcriptional regulator n=1 Tax=Actinorhabdospora filicis TaxID=1785913 RepID=A0A9W6WAJ8_9ACTN|nr:LacI family DNA-binding transcriptional regulator [Actinorhabdospora filicis]GLZ79729.1 LacI family transcriptional regulator [Actinorhabdospora filicis]
MSRPTLEQVARLAGVSRATVSRVVNGGAGVSAAVRDAVRAAVDSLGYVPNPAARSLVTRRTDSIALVVSESTAQVFGDDPFFADIVRGVSAELELSDKQLVLLTTDTAAGRDRVRRYTSAHVDGVLLVSHHGNDPLYTALNAQGPPVVCGGRPLYAANTSYVDVDNTGGAYKAVDYLIRAGRRRIATIAGPQDMNAGVDRLTGYRAAVQKHGRRAIVAYGDFSRDSGQAAMHALLADEPDLDAVFCGSDLMAVGALASLRAKGRRVPDDVAVIGFDDIQQARYAEPPLTTVHQPSPLLGREMVRMMTRILSGEVPVEPVTLPTQLVLRSSA